MKRILLLEGHDEEKLEAAVLATIKAITDGAPLDVDITEYNEV